MAWAAPAAGSVATPPHTAAVVEAEARETDARTVEERYGIPVENQRKFQAYVDRSGYVLDIRPTNPESVRWLRQGGLPKPQFLKSKTINSVDVRLGAERGMEGTVGYFLPTLPPRDSVPEGEWEKVQARYMQRWDEYHELESKMRHLEEDGVVKVAGGVVYGYDDKGDLKPYTGDHDLFHVRDRSGAPLPEAEYDKAINEMIALDMGVMHGAHMYWHPTTEFERRIYQKIVDQHQPGGEPLVRFAPHSAMYLVDAQTPVSA